MAFRWAYSVPLLLVSSASIAGAPTWATKDTQQLEGSILHVACSGTGPSIETARNDALNSCRASARQQLVTDIQVRSITIQTEKSAGFHEEVTENNTITGLTCIPEKDQVDEDDGSIKIWMMCKFDLKKVRVEPTKDHSESVTPIRQPQDGGIENDAQLSQVKTAVSKDKAGTIITGRSSSLSIASIPACESLIIRGQKPRTVNCDKNPVAVVLGDGDTEILVRAAGYEPKKIILNTERRSHETVQVILDPL